MADANRGYIGFPEKELTTATSALEAELSGSERETCHEA